MCLLIFTSVCVSGCATISGRAALAVFGRVWHDIGVVSCCVLSSATVLSCSLSVLFGVLTIYYIYMLNYLDTYTWCFYVSSSFKTYTNLHQSLDCCCKQNCIQFCSFCDCSPKGPAMSCQYHLCIRVMSCGFPLSSRQHRQHGNLNPPDTSMTHLPPQKKIRPYKMGPY